MLQTEETLHRTAPKDNATVVPATEQSTPTLREVMCLIRQDASKDALKYLMRSNTGHDGE